MHVDTEYYTFYHYTGYCAMHHAAAWGKLGVLKALVEAQSDLQQKNVHGERARETALRYNKTECVDFLDWAGMYILYTK